MDFQSLIILLVALVAGNSVATVVSLVFIHKVLLEIKHEVGFIRFMRETEKL